MTEFVNVAVDNGVMIVTLNRPEKKNAINSAMYAVMAEALSKAETDPTIRVVVFAANGDAFSAGNDLADFAAVANGSEHSSTGGSAFIRRLGQAEKPLVAAVQGVAVGIGVTLLLHCDMTFVAEDARLSTPFVNLALVPEAASSYLLPARVGYAHAYRMFALGEPVDGRTAAAIGLVTAAVPKDQVRAKAMEAAASLASRPAGALRATKMLMRDAALISATMQKELEIFGQRLKSPEAAEAFRAFAEKRPADFTKFG
jgi:enoyl-CoA hydratase/carnithine racemase